LLPAYAKNPIRDARVLGKTLGDGVTEAYSQEEIEDVITALVDRVDCQLIMALSFFAGLRKGEIAGLQWEDIDADWIHVRRNLNKGNGGLHLTTPKTKKSVRSVPLIQPVKGLLSLWRGKNTNGEFVFTSNLTTLAKGTIRPTLEKAVESVSCWKTRPRHYSAGTHRQQQCSPCDMLGHSTTQVTEAHYEAAMPEEVLKGMKLLEKKALKK
jgi:integrase